MKNNKKLKFVLAALAAFVIMFVYVGLLSEYQFYIWNILPLGDLWLFVFHVIACIPLIYVFVITKNLKKRPLYIAGYFTLFVFILIVVALFSPDGYHQINYAVNAMLLLGWAVDIAYVGCTRLGKIYLPIIMIVFLPSILTRYDIITYHTRPYFVIGTSVILQILISIIAAIYSAKHGIGKWHNLIFGTVSFSVTNLLAAFVSYIPGGPLWYIVLPLPYIITTLITMHFVKPRKVLTENSEAVAAE